MPSTPSLEKIQSTMIVCRGVLNIEIKCNVTDIEGKVIVIEHLRQM